MGNFFRKNWIWIASPIVVLALLAAVALLFFGEEGAAPLRYALF